MIYWSINYSSSPSKLSYFLCSFLPCTNNSLNSLIYSLIASFSFSNSDCIFDWASLWSHILAFNASSKFSSISMTASLDFNTSSLYCCIFNSYFSLIYFNDESNYPTYLSYTYYIANSFYSIILLSSFYSSSFYSWLSSSFYSLSSYWFYSYSIYDLTPSNFYFNASKYYSFSLASFYWSYSFYCSSYSYFFCYSNLSCTPCKYCLFSSLTFYCGLLFFTSCSRIKWIFYWLFSIISILYEYYFSILNSLSSNRLSLSSINLIIFSYCSVFYYGTFYCWVFYWIWVNSWGYGILTPPKID